MKKKQTKRLELSKETIAKLEQVDLVKAIGGSGWCPSSNPITDECCVNH